MAAPFFVPFFLPARSAVRGFLGAAALVGALSRVVRGSLFAPPAPRRESGKAAAYASPPRSPSGVLPPSGVASAAEGSLSSVPSALAAVPSLTSPSAETGALSRATSS